MKKIILLLSIMLIMVACDKKVPKLDKGKLNPNAMITIKAVETRSTINGLTALEIVEETMNMTFRSHWFGTTYYEEELILDRGFGDNQRDFDIPALLMFGTDIIETDGSFIKEFIYGYEFYLVNKDLDTIGYIPQSVIDNARTKIEVAYEGENYTEVYKLFDEAFIFINITE